MADCGRRNGYDCCICVNTYWCDGKGHDTEDGSKLRFQTKSDREEERRNRAYANALYDHLGRGRW